MFSSDNGWLDARWSGWWYRGNWSYFLQVVFSSPSEASADVCAFVFATDSTWQPRLQRWTYGKEQRLGVEFFRHWCWQWNRSGCLRARYEAFCPKAVSRLFRDTLAHRISSVLNISVWLANVYAVIWLTPTEDRNTNQSRWSQDMAFYSRGRRQRWWQFSQLYA